VGESPSIAFPPRYNAAVDLVDLGHRGLPADRLCGRWGLTRISTRKACELPGKCAARFGIEPEQRACDVMVDDRFFPPRSSAIKVGATVPINTMSPCRLPIHPARQPSAGHRGHDVQPLKLEAPWKRRHAFAASSSRARR
jgi:hypothetical protein